MINLFELINSSTDKRVLETIHLFPTDETETFWMGRIQLCGSGLKKSLKARSKCKTPKHLKKKVVVCFNSSELEPDNQSFLTIKLPQEAISSTKCKLYISNRKLVLQMAKFGENGPEIFRQQIACSSEKSQTKRSAWNNYDESFTLNKSLEEPHFDNFLNPLSTGLRNFLIGKPPNTIYELLRLRVHRKTCEVLTDLSVLSSDQGKFIWHGNDFREKPMYDPDPLVNEVIRRCLNELHEFPQNPLSSINEID